MAELKLLHCMKVVSMSINVIAAGSTTADCGDSADAGRSREQARSITGTTVSIAKLPLAKDIDDFTFN